MTFHLISFFLASTMRNLKKVVCRGGIETYLLDSHEHMQKSMKCSYVNTSFEILVEDIKFWKDTDCLWDDPYCKIEDY